MLPFEIIGLDRWPLGYLFTSDSLDRQVDHSFFLDHRSLGWGLSKSLGSSSSVQFEKHLNTRTKK